MIRLICAAVFLTSMSVGAEAAKPSVHDLSHVTCKDAYTVKFIKDSLGGMHDEYGRPFLSVLGNNSALTATLIYARKDSFACRISVNEQGGRGTQGVVGKFTYREFAGGHAPMVEFLPGY